jgi:2-iminobutanoate/2-iminopropanoate deaminase
MPFATNFGGGFSFALYTMLDANQKPRCFSFNSWRKHIWLTVSFRSRNFPFMNLDEHQKCPNPIASKRPVSISTFLVIAGGVLLLLTGAGDKAAKQFMNLDGKKPRGFSQIVVTPPGRTVYLSGIGGTAQDGTVPKDFATQVDNAFKNIGRALKMTGVDFKDIVKINYFVTDIKKIQQLREIRARYLNMQSPPAATLVQAGLTGELQVEIECIAVVPE